MQEANIKEDTGVMSLHIRRKKMINNKYETPNWRFTLHKTVSTQKFKCLQVHTKKFI